MRANDELRRQVLREALRERGEWSGETDSPADPEAH